MKSKHLKIVGNRKKIAREKKEFECMCARDRESESERKNEGKKNNNSRTIQNIDAWCLGCEKKPTTKWEWNRHSAHKKFRLAGKFVCTSYSHVRKSMILLKLNNHFTSIIYVTKRKERNAHDTATRYCLLCACICFFFILFFFNANR